MQGMVGTLSLGLPKFDSVSFPLEKRMPKKHYFSVPSIELNKDEETVSSLLSKVTGKSFSPEKVRYFTKLVRFILCTYAQGLPLPEIEGSYSENVSFEWRSDSIDEFIVTFKPDGNLIYSGVFKSGTTCGVEKFDGTNIPEVIKTGLLRTV